MKQKQNKPDIFSYSECLDKTKSSIEKFSKRSQTELFCWSVTKQEEKSRYVKERTVKS